jgi:hypothetical protein
MQSAKWKMWPEEKISAAREVIGRRPNDFSILGTLLCHSPILIIATQQSFLLTLFTKISYLQPSIEPY